MKPFIPRNFQSELAIPHILNTPRCGVYAGCGMGKTSLTLASLDLLMLAGEVNKPLVIAPLRVARNGWSQEARKWEQYAHLKIATITGTTSERQAALRSKADIYTVNYEQLPWLYEQTKNQWDFDCVVSDESTKLKGFRGSEQTSKNGKVFVRKGGGERTTALARVAHSKVKRFIELTGTPSPNGIKDLWGQMWFLDGGRRLGRIHSAFMQRWFKTGFDGYAVEPLPHAFAEVSELIKDLCLSLRAEDYFDLPGTIVNDIYVDLPPKAMQLYREMEREMFIEIASTGVEAFNAASKSVKCMQLANGAIYLDDKGAFAKCHDAKLEALESIVEESCGKPLMVAYNFKSDLARLKERFPKGRQLVTQRDEDDFKAGKIEVLFCHPDSAGHGIDDFQKVCNEIAFFGSGWNLETRHQIIERIGETRQAQVGNTLPVVIHNILARGTIDEVIKERVEGKRAVQDLLIDYMKRAA